MKIKSLLTFSFTVALTLTVNAKVWTVGDKVSNDAGNFVVSGQNLLPNPYFEDGFTGWNSGTGAELTSENFEILTDQEGITGNVLHSLTGGGSGGAGAVKTAVELTPGKTYLISWMQKKAGTWSRCLYSSNATSTSDNNAIIFDKSNTDEWTEETAIYTATEENPYIIYLFGWLSDASFAEFFVGEVQFSGEVNYTTLESTLNKANAYADEIAPKVGDKNGDYSQEAYDNLLAAIENGKKCLDENASQEEVNEAVARINDAMTVLSKSIVFHYEEDFEFEPDTEYYIQQVASGNFLSVSYYDDGKKGLILREGFENADKIKFVKPEGEDVTGYYMVNQEGYYVYNSNGWDSDFVTEITEENATNPKYLFEFENVDGNWVLKCVGNKYLATDGTWSWAPFYCDKGSNNANAYLRIASVIEKVKVNYSDLRTSIERAREVAAEAASNVGNETGNYSQEAYDNLMAAIDKGQECIDKKASQEEVDAAVVMVDEAVVVFQNSIVFNAEENFVLEAGAEYIFRMENGGRFLSYGWHNDKETLVMRDGFENASKITFVQPEGVEEGYNMIDAEGNYAYVSSSNAWDAFYTSAPEANVTNTKYLWTVETIEGHNVIKSLGSKYLAADGLWDWAPFYADKTWDFKDGSGNGWFQIAKVGEGQGAVEGMEVSSSAEKVYYDLNGRRVNAANLVKGIYVVRQGGKASKVVIK